MSYKSLEYVRVDVFMCFICFAYLSMHKSFIIQTKIIHIALMNNRILNFR